MTPAAWYLMVGLLLLFMALGGSILRRLPLTSALVYLGVGVGLGPLGLGLLSIDVFAQIGFLEHLTELAVIISLFTAGLKLRAPLEWSSWGVPIRLASVSMVITIGLIAAIGHLGLGLPLGAAILLGAILAPTDAVLASDVQVDSPTDEDRLRFGLTAEAGLNDGTAFPFVMLGLALLGLHEVGPLGWRWLGVDLLWATLGGLMVGAVLGSLVARLTLFLRRSHREAVGLDDFLALGLIGLAYGVAVVVHAYGFLAVFAAGLALRRAERTASGDSTPEDVLEGAAAGSTEEVATKPETAPAFMAQAVLGFNEQLERIAEVALVVLMGVLLSGVGWTWEVVWLAPVLFLLVRPLAVAIGLLGARASIHQQSLMAWFGIRGIGSLYYLMYAIQHGLGGAVANQLIALTLAIVAVSIVVHGVSVTPLMRRYRDRHTRAT